MAAITSIRLYVYTRRYDITATVIWFCVTTHRRSNKRRYLPSARHPLLLTRHSYHHHHHITPQCHPISAPIHHPYHPHHHHIYSHRRPPLPASQCVVASEGDDTSILSPFMHAQLTLYPIARSLSSSSLLRRNGHNDHLFDMIAAESDV